MIWFWLCVIFTIFFALFFSIWPSETDKALERSGLTRRYRGYFDAFICCDRYDYYCKCGTKLTEGPGGGMSVNAVCKKCMINYGDLPGFIPD